MKKNIWIASLFALASFAVNSASADEYIYKSRNKLDFVKLDTAKKDEKDGLNHPHDFDPEQIRAVLASLNFNKKILMLKDVENRNLFNEENVAFLTPPLVEAFKKAKPDQVVVVSYFTRDSKLVIQNDRLSIFRAYLKSDGLHLKFTKLYAKLLGDRGTLGAERMADGARGLRVSLELQPGQNRIAWDPEEIVVDLAQVKSPAVAAKQDLVKPAKKEKEIVRKTKTEAPVAEPVKIQPSASNGAKSVRDRLQELDQLRKDALITEKEYQAKKKELLNQL